MELSPPLKWYPPRFRDPDSLEPKDGAPYIRCRRASGRVKLKCEEIIAARKEALSGDDTTIGELMGDDDAFDLVMKVCVKHVGKSHGFEFEGEPVQLADLDDYPPDDWLDKYADDPIEEYSEPTKYGVLNRLGQGDESFVSLWRLYQQIVEGLSEDQKKALLKLRLSDGQTKSTSDAPAPSATDKPPSTTNAEPSPTSS